MPVASPIEPSEPPASERRVARLRRAREKRTGGERWADALATFGGSRTFLIFFGVFLFLWVVANSLIVWWKPVDPYPFILLNLVLSCPAAVQAPVILMSQNRQRRRIGCGRSTTTGST